MANTASHASQTTQFSLGETQRAATAAQTATPLAGETHAETHETRESASSRYLSTFLSYVHEYAAHGRVVISRRTARSTWRSATFDLAQLDEAAQHAVAFNATGNNNVFYRVHLIDREIPEWERGKSEYTSVVTHLAGDVDVAGPGHAPPVDGRELPPTFASATALIDETLPPSVIINSGGGLYPIWRLSEPFVIGGLADFARLRNVGRRLDRALDSHDWHVDHVCLDLARVIRPPGVINHKRGREPLPVIVERGYVDGAGDYRLEDLERLLPELPEPKHVKPRETHHGPTTGTPSPWELFARNYTIEDVLAADPRHQWVRVKDQNGMPAWRRDGSESDYSIKQNPDTGVIIVWSSVIAADLGVDPGDGLDLWGFACGLAGRDPVEAAKAVKR